MLEDWMSRRSVRFFLGAFLLLIVVSLGGC